MDNRYLWAVNNKLLGFFVVLTAGQLLVGLALVAATILASNQAYCLYAARHPSAVERQVSTSGSTAGALNSDNQSATVEPNTWANERELLAFFDQLPSSEPGQVWYVKHWPTGSCTGIDQPNQVTMVRYRIYNWELRGERSGYYPCGLVRFDRSCETYCKMPNGFMLSLLPEQQKL